MSAKQGGDSRTTPLPVWLHPRSGGVAIEVHAQPGARRTAVIGEHGGRLKIAVNAPPLDGRANEALIELLSRELDLPRHAVALETGGTSRAKRFFATTTVAPHQLVDRLLAARK